MSDRVGGAAVCEEQLFVSKRTFQRTCSKEHMFSKYQWNNDGLYSSKTVIFGNIDEQSVFTKHRLFIGAQQQDEFS